MMAHDLPPSDLKHVHRCAMLLALARYILKRHADEKAGGLRLLSSDADAQVGEAYTNFVNLLSPSLTSLSSDAQAKSDDQHSHLSAGKTDTHARASAAVAAAAAAAAEAGLPAAALIPVLQELARSVARLAEVRQAEVDKEKGVWSLRA